MGSQIFVHFALSLTISEIRTFLKKIIVANLGKFPKILKKCKIFKVCRSYILWTLWPQIFVCIALSLTISEITTFCTKMAKSTTFQYFFFFFFKFSENFEFKKNVVLWALMMHVIPNFSPFHSISNRFWVLNFY